MNTKRSDAYEAVVGEQVIVMGGWNWNQSDERTTSLDSCEAYEPFQKRWLSVPSMNTIRSAACAAVVGCQIVVMGGGDDLNYPHTDSCEIYDLEVPLRYQQ